MPDAQVITSGFLLHALGSDSGLHACHCYTTESGLRKSICNETTRCPDKPERCVAFLFHGLAVRDWGLVWFLSLCSAPWLSSPYPPPSFVDVHSRCFLSLVNSSNNAFYVYQLLNWLLMSLFWDIKVLLFNFTVANVTLRSSLKCLFSHLSLSFPWFHFSFICRVIHCRMAKAGLVERFALSLCTMHCPIDS